MTDLEHQISIYRQLLSQTDYKCLKYAEGALSEEEYAQTKADRAAWRAQINSLEQLKEGAADDGD